MQVFFDNGGGVTVQTSNFAHYYLSAKSAAADVKRLLAGESTEDWEGNEPENRIENIDHVHNTHYKVYNTHDIQEILIAGKIISSWHNVREFFDFFEVEVNK